MAIVLVLVGSNGFGADRFGRVTMFSRLRGGHDLCQPRMKDALNVMFQE